MAYRRTGLSAYPTDPYYDPARPSWLPYWIDDTTESSNKAAYLLLHGAAGPLGVLASPFVAAPTGPSPYTNPPAPATVQPPDMATDPTGQTVDVEAQLAAQQTASNAQLAQWAAGQSSATPVDNSSIGAILNKLAAPATGVGGLPTWVIVAGVGAVLFLAFEIGGRR